MLGPGLDILSLTCLQHSQEEVNSRPWGMEHGRNSAGDMRRQLDMRFQMGLEPWWPRPINFPGMLATPSPSYVVLFRELAMLPPRGVVPCSTPSDLGGSVGCSDQ